MRSKTMRHLLIIGILLVVALTATTMAVATSPWGPLSEGQPLPPTPGPVPTSAPQTYKGDPVTNRDEAIRRALHLDSMGTSREKPLTEDIIATNPDKIIVESYPTRQAASDVYWGDRYGDPEVAAEPVWVVIIKGKVAIRVVGGLGEGPEFVEAEGVAYVISQVDGKLLRVSTGIPKKQIERLP